MTDKPKNPSFRSDSITTPFDNPWRAAYIFAHKRREKRSNGAPLAKPHFSVLLLAPKYGAADVCPNYKLLNGLVMQAVTRANWGGWPQGGFWPIQDGDVPYTPKPAAPGQPSVPYDPAKYAWRKGNWLIEATNYSETVGPVVSIMQDGSVIDLPAQTFNGRQWYKGGDHCMANIQAWTFNNEKFGVNFGFAGLCFVKEGEAIGTSGPKSSQEMFAGAVTVPAGGPQMPTPGPQYAAPSPGGPPMPPGPSYTGPVPTTTAGPAPVTYTAPMPPGPAPGPSYAAPGPAAPAPMLPPMPPGVAAAPALPAFPPR